MIKVEFSGCGHYGICTIVPRNDLPAIMDSLKKRPGWYNPTFESHHCIGFDRSLNDLGRADDDSDEVRFGWNPRLIEDSMETNSLMTRVHRCLFPDFDKERLNKPGMYLEVLAGAAHRGWKVWANFSSDVWDVVESTAFQGRLPAINQDIQNWWEDQTWSSQTAQYTTVFKGKNGPTLQVYQPGLCISGSRNTRDSHQITDHNTDTAFLALGQIVSLCTVLKHCRELGG